jgi:hypothetical protein
MIDDAAVASSSTLHASSRPSVGNGNNKVDASKLFSNDDDDDKRALSLKKQRRKSHKSKKPPTDDSSDEPGNDSMDAAAATTQLHASTRVSNKKSGKTMQSKMMVDDDSNFQSSNKQKKKIRSSKNQQQQQQRVKKDVPRAVSSKIKKLPPRHPTRPRTTQTVGDSMPLPMTRPKKKNPPEKHKSLIAAHACSHCRSVVGSSSLYKCKCCASTDPDNNDNPGQTLCEGCCKSRFYGRCQECKSYLCHECSFVGWEDMDTEKGHLVCDGCALAMGGDALWKMLFE